LVVADAILEFLHSIFTLFARGVVAQCEGCLVLLEALIPELLQAEYSEGKSPASDGIDNAMQVTSKNTCIASHGYSAKAYLTSWRDCLPDFVCISQRSLCDSIWADITPRAVSKPSELHNFGVCQSLIVRSSRECPDHLEYPPADIDFRLDAKPNPQTDTDGTIIDRGVPKFVPLHITPSRCGVSASLYVSSAAPLGSMVGTGRVTAPGRPTPLSAVIAAPSAAPIDRHAAQIGVRRVTAPGLPSKPRNSLTVRCNIRRVTGEFAWPALQGPRPRKVELI